LQIAVALRRSVREHVGLPITVGVARTKFLAKVASGVAKPDGLLMVPPAAELAFLHPLPVERLWGVGKVTGRKLREQRLTTVGQVAALSETSLVELLGRASGRQLHALAHNRDPRRVERRRRRRSIGAQRALGRRRRSAQELITALTALVERVTRRLRTAQRMCRTIVLRMRFDNFERATRSHTLLEPTARSRTILRTAVGLLRASMPMIERRGITLIGIALANLIDRGPFQLILPFDRIGDLEATLDRVRDKFGTSAITRGVLVGQETGQWVPLLPD
jgi:DNA polymerase-4